MEKEKRCQQDVSLTTPVTAHRCSHTPDPALGLLPVPGAPLASPRGLRGSGPCISHGKYTHIGCPAAPELPEEGAHGDEASQLSPESSLGGSGGAGAVSSRRWGRTGAPISRGPAPPSGAAGPRHGGGPGGGGGTVLPWGTAAAGTHPYSGGRGRWGAPLWHIAPFIHSFMYICMYMHICTYVRICTYRHIHM